MIRNDPEKAPENLALEADATARLAQAGIRVSEERIRLLSLLMESKDRAWTAPDLRRLSLGDADDKAITTRLYRSLHLLEQKGVVSKEVRDTHGRPSFVYRLVGHEPAVQLRCRGCNRVVAADSALLRAQVQKAATQAGLAVAPGEMRVLVTCSRCAAGMNVDTNGLQ